MTTRRVIKVGGSLFDWPLLGPNLRAWLARCAADDNLLVAGGGFAADWIRQAQTLHKLPDEAAHWLAIRAMQLSACLLAELVPVAAISADPLELAAHPAGARLVIVDVFDWLRREPSSLGQRAIGGTEKGRAGEALSADQLPASWDVTSDSIAAHLAQLVAADELVLLKSTLPPAKSMHAAAAAGYVDRWLSQCWKRPVRCVNLRAEDWPEEKVKSEK